MPSPQANPPRQDPPSTSPRRSSPILPGTWILLVLLVVLVAAVLFQQFNVTYKTIDYSEFDRLVDTGQVAKLTVVGKERARGEVRDPESEAVAPLKLEAGKFAVQLPPSDTTVDDMIKRLKKDDQAVEIKFEKSQEGFFSLLAWIIFPVLLFLGVFFLIILPRMRDSAGGGFINSYGKSPARRYEKTKAPQTTFRDVAGMDNVKSELSEIVDFLKTPEKFLQLGAQIPKGVLLVGPPGTGKTLLARAVAGEAGVPFFSISGSEFIQMFVGVGASRVRDLFKTAKENSPCLVFIDEIDAVGRMRGAGVGGGSDEREQTLNQILSEMDGFQPNETVIVLAATNRPDVLDSALLRPGRFDRHITVDRPTWQGRLAILKVHTRNKPLADDVDLELIARKMVGMTGADLRNLANEAALIATRANKNKIDLSDFEHAADRILIGPLREEILTVDDRRRTAYHEAGHALTAWLEPAAGKPLKVTIIPRGRALGVNVNMLDEDRFHYGEDYFLAQLVTALGGRAADRLVYQQAFAGHENDLKQATRLARMMVAHWGMSDKVGPMALRIGEEHVFLGKEIQEARDFSEGIAEVVDQEVQRLLREADQRAYDLLANHRPELDKLVEALLEHEELTRDQLEQLLGSEANGLESDETSSRPVYAPGA